MRNLVTGALCASALTCPAAEAATSLLELIEAGRIELRATGLGGHSGECLRVEARNRSDSPIRTSIPAGWVFTSVTETVQDLIVVREAPLAMGPRGMQAVNCRAFCCEARNSGPVQGEAFRRGRPAPPKLFALAQAVDRGRYADDVVQHAVWVLSDGNDIGSMGALTGTAEDSLRHRVSELSGQPVPLYSMEYAPAVGQACSQRPAVVRRAFRMESGTPQLLTVVVRRDDGRIMEVLHDRTPLQAGAVSIALELHVLDWPPGRYAFQVTTTTATGAHRLPFTL